MQIGLANSLSLRRAWVAFSALALTLLLTPAAQADTATDMVGWGYHGAVLTFPSDVTQFTKVAIGGSTGFALKADGTVVAWGDNSFGQSDVPAGLSNVTDISAGDYAAYALKADGTVAAWGADYFDTFSGTAALTHVKAISAKYYMPMFVMDDGTVTVLGNGSPSQTDVPAGLTNVKAVASGASHCLALKEDGTVVAWGDSYAGETNVPAGLRNVKAIDAGNSFSAALRNDGTVVVWGDNSYGQCDVPAGLSGVVAISTDGYHTLALRLDGTVVGWGSNYFGESTPPADLTHVVSLAVGNVCSVALVSNQTSITLTKPGVYAGSTTVIKGSVAFTSDSASPRTVTLTSSDPEVVVPASVVVPAGAKTVSFKLTHYPVASTKDVTISGTFAEESFKTTISLVPIYVTKITFDGNQTEGGGTFNGILTLNVSPRERMSVTLSGDTPGTLFLNPTVDVEPSNTVAYFPITTQVVPTTTVVHVTAQAGAAPKTVPLTILASPRLKAFSLSKKGVFGNQKFIGTVTLELPAAAGGASVTLGSEPGCTVPSTVIVPGGTKTASFEIVADDVATSTVCNITASTYYASIGTSVTVKRNTVVSLALSTDSLLGGQTSTATITLLAPVDVDTSVDISIPSGYASAPATMIVPAGSSVGTVMVTANPTTKTRSGKVVASRLGLAKSQILTINP